MTKYFPVYLKYFCENLKVWCSRPIKFEECLLALLQSSGTAEVLFEVEDAKLIINPSSHSQDIDSNTNEPVTATSKRLYGPINLTVIYLLLSSTLINLVLMHAQYLYIDTFY